jgi:microcystin-dependent protein
MPATPVLQLPYPAATDPADVPTDMQELATRLDQILTHLVGSPIPWLTATIPPGYLEFNGQAITQAAYPQLYALFGATLPDLRGRYLMGVDGTHAIGTVGGEATHALSAAEMPAHTHAPPAGSKQYVTAATAAGGGIAGLAAGTTLLTPAATESAGGGGGHNNLPPYRTVRWITLAA